MKPRILMVISYFYPALGGAEQQALFLSETLRKRGYAVTVLSRSFKGLPACQCIRGLDVHRRIYTLPYGKVFGITYFCTCLWFLLRERKKYDVLHCHLVQGFHSIASVAMKCLFGKKVVLLAGATGPLSDFLTVRQSFCGSFLLRVITKADRLISLCSVSTQEALAAGFTKRQIVNIPNGVDTARFIPAPALPGAPRLLFIGRLDRMKGVDVLLQSLAALRKEGRVLPCDIVGSGPLQDELQGAAAGLGVAGQVHFHGACGDVVPLLQRASCFVLPSRSEGMPNVLLEAMACGLPIIATTVGGIPDFIQDGRNGLLVPPDDPAALAAAIARLHAEPGVAGRLANQARRDAMKLYRLDAVADRYAALYRDLTA